MRQARSRWRPSPAQRRVYLRRRIVAGAIAVLIVVIPIYLFTRGGGRSSKLGGRSTSTTAAPRSTTTVPLRLVVGAATWTLPIPLSRTVVLPINTNLGVFGGLTTGSTSKSIYQVDPQTGIATNVGTLPAPVHDASGAVIAGNYFVFGGGAATETSDVQHFTFTNSNKLAGSVAAQLPAKRADSASTTSNGQYYVVGGFDGKKWLPDVLATTDGTTFNAVAQLSTPVRYPAAAALNGKLYVIGGELSPNQADATSVIQIDLQTFAVTALNPIPTGLSHASAAVLNGAIYVFGGRSGGHAIATVSLFNPATGQLQPVGALPSARSDMGVAVVGNTAYLVGGEADNGKPVTGVFVSRLVPAGSAAAAP